MTHVGPAPANSSTASTSGSSFVEWGAVLAGAVLAVAISFVLLTFGAAIGLSATSPWPNSGVSAKVIASVAVFWAMAQQIGAFMAGGYVAGRMRSRWHETGHEADFRDGLHGGLVWAVVPRWREALLPWRARRQTVPWMRSWTQCSVRQRSPKRQRALRQQLHLMHPPPQDQPRRLGRVSHRPAMTPVTKCPASLQVRWPRDPSRLRTAPIWPNSCRSGPACRSRKPRNA